jgi:hypothetical protein
MASPAGVVIVSVPASPSGSPDSRSVFSPHPNPPMTGHEPRKTSTNVTGSAHRTATTSFPRVCLPAWSTKAWPARSNG